MGDIGGGNRTLSAGSCNYEQIVLNLVPDNDNDQKKYFFLSFSLEIVLYKELQVNNQNSARRRLRPNKALSSGKVSCVFYRNIFKYVADV